MSCVPPFERKRTPENETANRDSEYEILFNKTYDLLSVETGNPIDELREELDDAITRANNAEQIEKEVKEQNEKLRSEKDNLQRQVQSASRSTQ